MDQGSINLHCCLALFDGLVGAGVQQIVLSPGSRNTPLTLAAVLHPQLTHRVAVDERSAAFLALGMAMMSQAPVVLLCTSGTAAANWLPAVVEASRQQLPLLLISADRPWELQQCQANQTIDQMKLFGSHVRAFHQLSPAEASQTALHRLRALGRQLVGQSAGLDAGPVHVNMPLREPLVPEVLPEVVPRVTLSKPAVPQCSLAEEELRTLADCLSEKKGLILCGPGTAHEEVLGLGKALTCPVLADPLSGLRFTPSGTAISHYDLFLRDQKDSRELQAEWILHFGGTLVSKSLLEYLNTQTNARQWWVDESGRWMDRPGTTVETLQASPEILCRQLLGLGLQPAPDNWLQRWQTWEQRVKQRLQELELPLEASIMRHALQALPEQSLWFSGNSMAVRFLDAYSGSSNKEIAAYGNRGASGIDGNLSTLTGLATAFEGKGKVLGVIGDLAFFHDLNALALAREQDMILLLLNNRGGGIFDFLPQHQLPEYVACWRTPVPLDHQHIARAFDVAHVQVRDLDAFERAFSEALNNPVLQLIEVVIDSTRSNPLHKAVVEQCLG